MYQVIINISLDIENNEVFMQNTDLNCQKLHELPYQHRLQVDEDDYLMPSPGPLGTAGAYMDLIADSKHLGKFSSSP